MEARKAINKCVACSKKASKLIFTSNRYFYMCLEHVKELESNLGEEIDSDSLSLGIVWNN